VWENPSRAEHVANSRSPLHPLHFLCDKTESSSSPEAAGGGDRDRDQLRGKVEEGLILYLNTGLSEDYMHFNYRPDAAALTLSCRPGIVKFLNYRYSGQGCGALNPKDSLHFELLATLDTKTISVRNLSNNKNASLLRILLLNLIRNYN